MKYLVYGYGKEGKSTYNYLKKNYPNDLVDIYDDKIEEYRIKPLLSDYDKVFLAPGISYQKVFAEIKYDYDTNQAENYLDQEILKLFNKALKDDDSIKYNKSPNLG